MGAGASGVLSIARERVLNRVISPLQEFFSSKPASFGFPCSVVEGVKRLSMTVEPSVLGAWFKEAVIGRVSASKVRLYRHGLVPRGSGLLFIGSFRVYNGLTVLEGRFTKHWYPKVFMGVWFGALAVFSAVGALFMLDAVGYAIVFFLLGVVLIGLFGLALVALMNRQARSDMQYISDTIQRSSEPNSN